MAESPSKNDQWRERMRKGRFEGANKPDFSDAQILYSIKKADAFNAVKITNPKKFRYVRYVSPENGLCNVAEIAFYGKSLEKLSGTIIGTLCQSAHDGFEMSQDKAFDNDVLTFFEADTNSDGWIGLDLSEKQLITEIHYMPRNDGNGIVKGNIYELYYWAGQHWQLFGRQTATEYDALHCRIPSNALFYIKNITRDAQTFCVFIMQDGMQKWLQN